MSLTKHMLGVNRSAAGARTLMDSSQELRPGPTHPWALAKPLPLQANFHENPSPVRFITAISGLSGVQGLFLCLPLRTLRKIPWSRAAA